jgi:hypothetical protein
MMTEQHLTTLASTVLKGDDRVVLCTRSRDIHYLTIGPGTPYEERIRAWDCEGIGPYMAHLGYDKDHPLHLASSHLAGTAVRIDGVSPELAAARRKSWNGPCSHPDVEPVETLAGELVAWLCAGCDEKLPPDWRSPPFEYATVLRDHEVRHHGHPRAMLFGCRLCAEESGL